MVDTPEIHDARRAMPLVLDERRMYTEARQAVKSAQVTLEKGEARQEAPRAAVAVDSLGARPRAIVRAVVATTRSKVSFKYRSKLKKSVKNRPAPST